MSHWNHRVIHRYDEKTDNHTYQVHEVYYDDKGIIEGWTESAVGPFGETPSELREDIRYLIKAFHKPILLLTIQDGEEVLVVDEDAPEIKPGHYPEFLDRVWVAEDYIWQFLGSHPLLRKEKRLQDLFNKAGQALSDLYQEAGKLYSELDALVSRITPENAHAEIEFGNISNVSKSEYEQREEAVRFACASVALEGFELSDEYAAELNRYIEGEVDLSGLKDYLDMRSSNSLSWVSEERREYIEGHYTCYRTTELVCDPAKGDFDIDHLKEVNRRIFQDLPGFGFDDVTPGQFRPSAPANKDWIKQRALTSVGACSLVAYSPMDEGAQRQLNNILSNIDLVKLRELDLDKFVEEMGKLYIELDYIHPFNDGNSRTLRVFTRQLANEAGYILDWSRFAEGNAGRDILYIARDLSVNEIALQSAKNADTKREVAFSLDQFNGNKNLPDLLSDVVSQV